MLRTPAFFHILADSPLTLLCTFKRMIRGYPYLGISKDGCLDQQFICIDSTSFYQLAFKKLSNSILMIILIVFSNIYIYIVEFDIKLYLSIQQSFNNEEKINKQLHVHQNQGPKGYLIISRQVESELVVPIMYLEKRSFELIL